MLDDTVLLVLGGVIIVFGTATLPFVLSILVVDTFMEELLQVMTQKMDYFKRKENILDILMIILIPLTLVVHER